MAKLSYFVLCFTLFLAFAHFQAAANARSTINFKDDQVAQPKKDIAVGRRMMQDPPPLEEDCLGKPCNDQGGCDYEGCECITAYSYDPEDLKDPHCVYDE